MGTDGTFSKRVNLKLLQAFLMVAENSSFRTAAEHMNRTQAAVSAQVKQLEEQLGIQLFHRTTRHVKLTADGELLRGYARRAVAEVEEGLQQILERSDMKRGNVTFACSPTLVPTHLPPILRAFKRDYPEVVLSLLELKSHQLFEALRSNDVDFAIGPVTDHPEFDFEPIISERVFLVAHRDLLPRGGSTIALEAMSGLPLIRFYDNTVLARQVNEAASRVGCTLNIRYQCIQGQTLIALSEAGLGAAIMVETLTHSVHGPDMRKLLIVEPEMRHDFAIIKKRGQRLSTPALRMIDLLLRHASAAA